MRPHENRDDRRLCRSRDLQVWHAYHFPRRGAPDHPGRQRIGAAQRIDAHPALNIRCIGRCPNDPRPVPLALNHLDLLVEPRRPGTAIGPDPLGWRSGRTAMIVDIESRAAHGDPRGPTLRYDARRAICALIHETVKVAVVGQIAWRVARAIRGSGHYHQ